MMKNMDKRSVMFLSLLVFLPLSVAQIVPAESRILFQVVQLVELYPPQGIGWSRSANLCSLPPSRSLVIVCSANHITELTLVGNRTSHQTLSHNFSIHSFFTILTKLSNLKLLSLVSLGLWGSLPPNINRFRSLQLLNITSNPIVGNIPASISTLAHLNSLVLADNLFNGSVPDLTSLQNLQQLDLANNRLGPIFPSLGRNLVSVVLRNNSFRFEIPSVFLNFDRLERLDVSSNKLVGPIPSFLFSLLSIQYLNLAKNQLSGALPTDVSCNKNLTFVDISNNLLIGKLPPCIGLNSMNRTVISLWNCLSNTSSKYQHPYSFCHKEALAVKPPSMDQEKKESTMKLGVVLGILGGIVGIVGASGTLILVIFKRSQAKKARGFKSDSFVFDQNPGRGSPIVDGGRRPQTMRRTATFGLPRYQNFTLEEMEDATNNFDPSNLVGEGSQEQIYKGWLRDGSTVVVKCLKVKQKQSPQALKQHTEMISKLRHRHLVSVLGHCTVAYLDHPSTESTVFIVLEYVGKGSLRDHLTDWRKKEMLKWPQRMAITMGIAKGIQFLHTGLASGNFGNDLKIENILLDDSLTPKITCYNIPLPSKVGSEGPPLNRQEPSNLQCSDKDPEKDDIYQFGVILLQVITGKLFNSKGEIAEMKLQLEMNLTETPSRLREAADPSIQGTFAYESLKTAIQITVNCLAEEDPSKRPSIEDVLWHMQYSIQVQEGWTSSGNLNSGNLNTNL